MQSDDTAKATDAICDEPPSRRTSGDRRQGAFAMTRRAFTLIELLVTIAIIGVLIGLIIPTMASALGSASRVACQANLRSIGQAMAMYLQDGDGLLPCAYREPDVAAGERKP
jgi:prepilin-type N-terminal cleavage/methylation domain-containing protein